MKFGKPIYLADQRSYKSEITDGFRYETSLENNSFSPTRETFVTTIKPSLIQTVVQNTKGWFSKPLTEAWLTDRIEILFPIQDLSQEFEGTLIWEAKELVISKDKFTFGTVLIEKKETPKVMIDFPEIDFQDEKKQSDPSRISQTCLKCSKVGTVRRRDQLTREEFKQLVRDERERAGRALFRAERLTQEYCQLYGDETDWEESDEDESEH